MNRANFEYRMSNIGSDHGGDRAREEDEKMTQMYMNVFPTFDIRYSIFAVLQP